MGTAETISPRDVLAKATAEELKVFIPLFELAGCDFIGMSASYIRAITGDPTAETFTHKEVSIPVTRFMACMLLLSPLGKPIAGAASPNARTLQPFAELLEKQSITHLRAVGRGNYNRDIQVSQNGGQHWRTLRLDPLPPQQPEPLPQQPALPQEEPHA